MEITLKKETTMEATIATVELEEWAEELSLIHI